MLTRRRTILAALEATYGVDAAPTGALNAILVKSLNVTPMSASVVSRDLIRPFFGNYQQLIADAHVQLDFEVELAGSGTAGHAPAYDCLLQACAMVGVAVANTSYTYSPISTGIKSATIYFNNDGALHKITGAFGDAEITVNAKAIPTIKFTMTGLYHAPTAAALPAADFSHFLTPVVANSTNTPGATLLGFQSTLSKFSMKLGNQVDFRSLIGKQYVQVLDRKVAGSFEIEAVTPDVQDFFTPALAGTTGAFTMTHGTVAGNIVEIAMTGANIQNPTYADDNGTQMLQIPYVGVPTAGNDEFSLIFT